MGDAIIERLRQDVGALALPEGRTVGSQGHRRAEQFLLGRLRHLGLLPYRGESFQLPYRREGRSFCNLAAAIPGTNRSLPPALIGAHYDSVISAPCADDNAAAVAIALSAAEQLAGRNPHRDVAILLFDAEEPPYYMSQSMGSIAFYDEQMLAAGVHVAVIMDLVGHDVPLPMQGAPMDRLRNLLFMTGAESHPRLPDAVRDCPREDLPLVATLNRNIGAVSTVSSESHYDLSDQYVFRTHNVPYLFLSCGHWQHYHAPTDTPEKLNYEKMAQICQFLVDLVDRLAHTDLGTTGARPGNRPSAGSDADTVAFECELLQEALGSLLPPVLALLGVAQLKTRADLDLLARGMQRTFAV